MIEQKSIDARCREGIRNIAETALLEFAQAVLRAEPDYSIAARCKRAGESGRAFLRHVSLDFIALARWYDCEEFTRRDGPDGTGLVDRERQ